MLIENSTTAGTINCSGEGMGMETNYLECVACMLWGLRGGKSLLNENCSCWNYSMSNGLTQLCQNDLVLKTPYY